MPDQRTARAALALGSALLVVSSALLTAACSTTTSGTGTRASPANSASSASSVAAGGATAGPTTPGSTTPGSTTPGSTTPGSTTPGSTTPGSATPSSAPAGSAAAGVPSAEQLRAALLTQAQVGPGFLPQSTSGGGSGAISGCPRLDPLLGRNAPSAGQQQAEISYQSQSGTTIAVVLEGLLAEPPAQLAADYAQLSTALGSCTQLDFPAGDGAPPVALGASPITFAAGATALRLDGQLSTIPINGYLAVDRVRPSTALVFFFLQTNSGSSQLASALFATAVQNAGQKLPG